MTDIGLAHTDKITFSIVVYEHRAQINCTGPGLDVAIHIRKPLIVRDIVEIADRHDFGLDSTTEESFVLLFNYSIPVEYVGEVMVMIGEICERAMK